MTRVVVLLAVFLTGGCYLPPRQNPFLVAPSPQVHQYQYQQSQPHSWLPERVVSGLIKSVGAGLIGGGVAALLGAEKPVRIGGLVSVIAGGGELVSIGSEVFYRPSGSSYFHPDTGYYRVVAEEEYRKRYKRTREIEERRKARKQAEADARRDARGW